MIMIKSKIFMDNIISFFAISQLLNKWFAKTLYSIKETAVASSSGLSKAANATGTSITKSTSVDVLTQNSN